MSIPVSALIETLQNQIGVLTVHNIVDVVHQGVIELRNVAAPLVAKREALLGVIHALHAHAVAHALASVGVPERLAERCDVVVVDASDVAVVAVDVAVAAVDVTAAVESATTLATVVESVVPPLIESALWLASGGAEKRSRCNVGCCTIG